MTFDSTPATRHHGSFIRSRSSSFFRLSFLARFGTLPLSLAVLQASSACRPASRASGRIIHRSFITSTFNSCSEKKTASDTVGDLVRLLV